MSESAQSLEEALFDLAAAKPTAEERRAFLDGVCRDNPELRARLEILLEGHFEGEGFLTQDPEKKDLPEALPQPGESPARMIGRYKLLEKVGEGGFGEVWMAEQREPVKRRVALKILKPGMDSRQVVARFEAERQALAMMDHPNIAKILDAGMVEEGSGDRRQGAGVRNQESGGRSPDPGPLPPDSTASGRPYFVMELVRGVKITDYCDQQKLSTQERLDLFMKVCHAIQHAHQKGIIHRDIKPSNILVTLHDGVPVPKVIDFGIAKAMQGELTDKTMFTQFQQFLGTPDYISPEQAEISGLDIDTRSDIYSLGVLLYELLVGQTPLNAMDLLKGGLDCLRRAIREKDPLKPSTRLKGLSVADLTTAANRRHTEPSRLTHQLRGDLDWIVMKCLEKDRARRYETANGLAMDVQRYLNNEPVTAVAPSPGYLARKYIKRHKTAVGATVAIALILISATAVSAWLAVKASRAEDAERGQRIRAEAEEEKAVYAQAAERDQRIKVEVQEEINRRLAYASDMQVAQVALDRSNLQQARVLLDRHRPKPGQEDLRGWEWRHLWAQARADKHRTLCRLSDTINFLSVSSDGRFLAVTAVGKVTLWDLQTAEQLGGPWSARVGVFSPTEPLLAWAGKEVPPSDLCDKLGIRLMNLSDYEALANGIRGMQFSGDGQSFVVTTTSWNKVAGAQMLFFSVPDGTPGTPISVPQIVDPGSGWPVSVTEDLRRAAYGTGNATGSHLHLADFEDATHGWESQPLDPGQWVETVAFSPDATTLAVGLGVLSPDIRLWGVKEGWELRRLEGHKDYIKHLVFLPHRRILASASADQTIRLWDVSDIRSVPEPRILRGHQGEVTHLATSPDGNTLISGGRDGMVLLWDVSDSGTSEAHHFRFRQPGKLGMLPDQSAVITCDFTGRVKKWTSPGYQNATELFLMEGDSPITQICVSEDGSLAAAFFKSGRVKVWRVVSRQLRHEFRYEGGGYQECRFLPHNEGLILYSTEGEERRTQYWSLDGSSDTRSWSQLVRISPDRRLYFYVKTDSSLGVLCSMETGQELLSMGPTVQQAVGGLEFSRDSQWCAMPGEYWKGGAPGIVSLWDVEKGERAGTLGEFLKSAHSVAFSPDQRRLIAGSSGSEAIKIWELTNHQELLTLAADGGPFDEVRFLGNGNVLVARSEDGDFHCWPAPSWEEIAAAESLDR